MTRRIVRVRGVRRGMPHDRAQRTATMHEAFLGENVERTVHSLIGETKGTGQFVASRQSLTFRDQALEDLPPVMLGNLDEDWFTASVVEDQARSNIFQ